MLIAYSILITLLLIVSLFYLYRLVRIIMILEDDFAESLESLDRLQTAVDNVLKMQLFFDSKEVKNSVNNLLEELNAARMDINAMIRKFVDRSKNKYIIEVEEEDDDIRVVSRDRARNQLMMQNRAGMMPPGDFSDYQ